MINQQDNNLSLLKKIENYQIYMNFKIGEGSFSQVFKGVDLNTHAQVAVKIIRTADIKSKIARRLLEWEKSILKNMDHANIIKCLDIHDSVNNCYIITQYCNNGDLDTLIKQKYIFKPETISKIVCSIYDALYYLNERGIIHRDLKASNIFIQDDSFKLGDFGFAIRSDKIFKDIAVGSPIYMSPQGLLSNLYGPKTDIWSFGVLIYELLHGVTPLASCKSEQQLKQKVLEEAPIRMDIDKDLVQLLRGCLKVNQSQRFDVRQLGQCHYIRKIKGLVHMDIEKDLTNTKQTMCSSVSENNSLRLSEISYETALAIMQYCRFLNNIIQIIKPSPIFSKFLILISNNLKQAIIKGNLTQQKYKNLHEIIREYNQNYLKQYGGCHKFQSDHINLSEMVMECQKAANTATKYKQVLKNLCKETSLLQRCSEMNNMQVFSRKSKTKQYLNQFKF